MSHSLEWLLRIDIVPTEGGMPVLARRFVTYFGRRAWWCVGWGLLLGLAACGVADQHAANQPTLAPSATLELPAATTADTTGGAAAPTSGPVAASAPSIGTQPVSSPVVRIIHSAPPAATTTAAAGLWQTYQSVPGRYTVEYPAGWIVNEQAGADGAVTTTFTVSGGGARIVVMVRPSAPAQQEPLDLPNVRCQPAPGNRGIATRCLDTIARTTSTTFVSQGRSYTISTEGNTMDETIYQHVLDSFAQAERPTSPVPTNLESLLLQPGDLPGAIAGEPTDDPTPPNFANDPPATTIIGRRLTRDGRGAGSVSLLFYDTPSDLAQAYQRLTANADPFTTQTNAMEPRTDVGDHAMTARLTLASSTYGPTHIVVVIFARCHAVIDIRLNEREDLTLDTAVAYAKRLDRRIAAVVCQ